WRVIGSQVVFSVLNRNLYSPKTMRNLDQWDGYPAERQKIIQHLIANNINNNIFIAGDTHVSYAMDAVNDSLLNNGYAENGNSVGVELVTPSISSGNQDEDNPIDSVIKWEKATLGVNPHVKFADLKNHGFVLLEITEQKATASWYFVETIDTISDKMHLAKQLEIPDKSSF
ncbi:MAG: hypothetical protein HC896_18200, partial [Bacteroidales bacterium]|nr:hypothetical protein [Bacteroidales bacterium]